MCGLIFATAHMTRATYTVFAWGMIPFFFFNVYYTLVDPVFNSLMLIDAGGSAIIAAACLWGLRTLKAEVATQQRKAA